MPYRFKYKAVSPKGDIQKGYFEAEDIQTAKRNLDLRGLIPISVESDESYKGFFKKYFKPSVNLEILLAFTKKFNTLIKAGIPMLRALDIIEDENVGKEAFASVNVLAGFIQKEYTGFSNGRMRVTG